MHWKLIKKNDSQDIYVCQSTNKQLVVDWINGLPHTDEYQVWLHLDDVGRQEIDTSIELV
jgi:hypothetical protein